MGEDVIQPMIATKDLASDSLKGQPRGPRPTLPVALTPLSPALPAPPLQVSRPLAFGVQCQPRRSDLLSEVPPLIIYHGQVCPRGEPVA